VAEWKVVFELEKNKCIQFGLVPMDQGRGRENHKGPKGHEVYHGGKERE
jgi:hypothetical protein